MGDRPPHDQVHDIRHDRRSRWHVARRIVVLALVLGALGAVSGAWWGEKRAASHGATAVILLNPLEGNPFSPDARGDDLVNLETEALLVTSDTVLAELGVVLGTEAPVDPGTVSVSVPTNTQLLSISVSGTSDAAAQDATQNLALIYLQHRRTTTESALANQRANIDAQVEQTANERRELISRLDDLPPGAPGTSLLTQQVLATVNRISELRSQLGEVGSVSLDPGQVVTPARADGPGPLPRGPWVPGLLGALLGAAIGWIAAAQLWRGGDLIRSREDLEDLRATVWGSVPAETSRRPVAASRLRAVVLAATPVPPTVVLTCRIGTPSRSAGHSGLAAGLSGALAAAGVRTIMVDLDDAVSDESDRTRGHQAPHGLADVLRGDCVLEQTLTWTGDLGRVHAGRDSEDLDDLAASPGMAAALETMLGDAALVLLGAGSPLSPRAQALAATADVVLVEVPAGTTRRADVDHALSELDTAGAKVVGLLLVAPHPRPSWHEGVERVSRTAMPLRAAVLRTSRRLARSGAGRPESGGARD